MAQREVGETGNSNSAPPIHDTFEPARRPPPRHLHGDNEEDESPGDIAPDAAVVAGAAGDGQQPLTATASGSGAAALAPASHTPLPSRHLRPVRKQTHPPPPTTPHRRAPLPRSPARDAGFIAEVVAGKRIAPPWDSDLLVSDALGAGNLSLSFACLVRTTLLKDLPAEVVTHILAFCIERRLYVSPYCGPGPRATNGHERYTTFDELWAFRDPATQLRGIPDHNTTFPMVCPYPLYDGDEVYFESSGLHSFGLGLVCEGVAAPSYGVRFNAYGVGYYQGIGLVHNRGPELEVKTPAKAQFAAASQFGALALSLHIDPATKRRYARIRSASASKARTADAGLSFWLPDVFNAPVVATATSRGGHLPRVFAAAQVWNNGWAQIGGPIARVPPSEVPPPPADDAVFRP